MPIYEYQCRLCNHHLETLQKASDEPLTLCPACKKDSLVKLISATHFQLKGTGWYATDFRDKQKPTTDTKAAEKKEESNNNTAKDNETSTNEKKPSGNNGEAA